MREAVIDEAHRGAFVGGAHPAPAVTASVMEGSDASFEIAHHDHRVVADLKSEEGPRVCNLAVVTDE